MLSAAVSCSYSVEDAPFFNEESAPAMPCLISGDTTLLIVRDYFPRIEKVDAVSSEDYTVIPVSVDDMDTVMLVAGPSSGQSDIRRRERSDRAEVEDAGRDCRSVNGYHRQQYGGQGIYCEGTEFSGRLSCLVAEHLT